MSSEEVDLFAAEANIEVSSAEEDLFAAEANIEVSSAEEDLLAAEASVEMSSAEEDLLAAEASVSSRDTFAFLFLGEGFLSLGRRGELDRLRCDREGDRLNICEGMPSSREERAGRRPAEGALGGRIFGGIFACLGFVAFGTYLALRVVPGWPARSGSVELGTSRVVGKQGER